MAVIGQKSHLIWRSRVADHISHGNTIVRIIVVSIEVGHSNTIVRIVPIEVGLCFIIIN